MAARSEPVAAAPFPPLGSAFTIAALGFLAWGVTTEAHPGLGGSHLVVLLLLLGACAGWVGWAVVRSSEHGERAGAAIALGVTAAAGGALVPFTALAVTFVGVAALGAAVGWSMRIAGWVTAVGLAAMLIAVPAAGHSLGVLSLGFGVTLAGAAMGLSRRQAQERAAHAVMLSVATERANIEQARAELLADRNHLARELHDVLAHTLAALSLQLEALDTTVHAGERAVSPDIVQQVDRTKRLVREGLAEARNAVRALRDDLDPLPAQLDKLAVNQQSSYAVVGDARALSPQVTLALYRAAQEGLTNAMKHAPGAATAIELTFGPEQVNLTVTNGPAGTAATADDLAPLAASGSGYGLAGIEERLQTLGGSVEVGPSNGGWRLEVRVPT
jgi:signal transduction histidine kinase